MKKKTFDITTGNLIRDEITEISKEKIFQKTKIPKLGDVEGFVETKQTYVFAYHSQYRKDLDKFLWDLEIQENIKFHDPLLLESALFFPDQLNFDRLDATQLRKSLEFYMTFPFYNKGSGENYVKKLVDEILLVKPFKEAIEVAQELKSKKYKIPKID